MRPEPYKGFQDLLRALAEHAASTASDQVPYKAFSPIEEPLDPSDVDAVRTAFGRDDINAGGEETFFKSSLGLWEGATLQVDYMAQAERAYFFRHMSRSRARAHAVARRRGHGSDQGVFTGEILQHVQDVLATG